MEVRSKTEQCGSDATAVAAVAAATATAATTTAVTTSINQLVDSKTSSDAARAVVSMDLSRTMVNDETKPPLTRDEKLVAELKSQIPDVDNIFKIHRRIGEGTFSTVFLTSLRCQEGQPKKRLFALKYLIPTSHPRRIAQELRCLKEIGGKDNVVGVDLCLRNKDSIAFVMPYMPHDRFHEYFDKMCVKELQEYMGNLLTALNRVHEFDVIHRDVKPSNFLHDRKNHKFLLVDFGLAQALDKESDSTKLLRITGKEIPSEKSNSKPNVEKIQCDNESEQSTTMAAQMRQTLDTSGTERMDMAESSADNCADAADVPSHKRKLSESDETENKRSIIETNPSKRPRTLTEHQSINENNTSQHPRGPYIPSSHFKAPLKQMNEISNQIQFKRGSNEFQSPLSADIKSTVLSYSIGSKIESQRNSANSMSSASKLNSSAQMVTPKMPFPKHVTTTERVLSTPTPPGHKYNLDNRSSGRNVKCFCYGRPTVCNVCLIKKEIQATRAGTPGYRPTEVLLKYANQTTAVDCWAAGVILISILSGCYPFFKSRDDFNALAEIITVFGDEVVRKTANALGRHVCISHKKRPLHLRKLCLRLRNRHKIHNTPFSDNNTTTTNNSTNLSQHCDNCEQPLFNCLCQDSDYNQDFSNDIYPDSVYDLLGKLLAINPHNRISANDALKHQFFQEAY